MLRPLRASVVGEKTRLVEQFDAIVIGSGFGGSVAASRLSQAGFRVLLLERGRRYEAGDFPALPDDDRLLPDLRRWVWSQDEGLWDIQDLGEIVSVQAAGYGGGSLLYANVHLRPPEGTFDQNWPAPFRGDSLERYFDLAAYMMNAAPITERPGGSFPKTEIFAAATKGLGRAEMHPPLAINYVAGQNEFGVEQNACTGCGKCCTGCPESAKNTLDYSYLAVAERFGAVVRTQCEVKTIVQQGDDAPEQLRWRVEYVDHLAASREHRSAKYLFVCAGVVNTTRLLRQARLLEHSKPIQPRVGLAYFPNADAAAVVYDTRKECEPSNGPCITIGTTHWERREKRAGEARPDRFFMIQDGGYAPELERLLGILRAPLWTGRNRTHDAAPHCWRPKETPRARTSLPGVALVSPLDALLDAAADGAFSDSCPPSLRSAWDGFLRQVEQPLLMPFIVAATIERSAKARYARLPAWLKRIMSYESPPVHAFKSVFKWFIQFVGGDPEVGHQALQAVLAGSDLDRNRYLSEILGYDGQHAKRRMMLLAMGEDAAPGTLLWDENNGLTADLDLYNLTAGYTQQELVFKDMARELGGELRLNPMWSFFGKPITVHSQGGCGMSEHPCDGVTDPNGQVRGCPGLYVMDASVLCRSVGVNPTPTILAIAERNVLEFIRSARGNHWPELVDTEGAAEYRRHLAGAESWRAKAKAKNWSIRPTEPARSVPFGSAPLGLKFKETFHGYCAKPDGDPSDNDRLYRLLEIAGRPACPFVLHLEVYCEDLNRFFEDYTHELQLSGTLQYTLPGAKPCTKKVKGSLELFVPRVKPYGLPEALWETQRRSSGYRYTTVPEASLPAIAAGACRAPVGMPHNPAGVLKPFERYMYYHLDVAETGLRLEGYKRVRDDPGLDAWRDTTALFTRFGKPLAAPFGAPLELLAAGVVHVDLTGFLYGELPAFSVRGGEGALRPEQATVIGTEDPARITWALTKFSSFFFGTLQRVYSPVAVNVADALFQPIPNGVRHEPRLRV